MITVDKLTLTTIHRFLDTIARKYDLSAAILYGSRARGLAQEHSDIDLALILNSEHRRRLDLIFELSDAAWDVAYDLDFMRRLSPNPILLSEWLHPETMGNPELIHNIKRDGILIWSVEDSFQLR